jgi:hypothetical protein
MQPMYIKYNSKLDKVVYNIEDVANSSDDIVLYIKNFNREQLLSFIDNVKDTMEQWTIK